MKKRLRVVTYSFFGFFLLFIVAAYGLLQSPVVSSLALRFLTEEISRNLEGTLTFVSADGTLASGITVRGLAIATPERKWLSVDTLFLRFDPFTLFFGLFNLKEVHADGAMVTLRRDTAGALSLPFMLISKTGIAANDWKLLGRLDSVILTHGTLQVLNADHVEERLFRLNDLQFRGHFGFSSFFTPGGWSAWCEVQESGFLHVESGLKISASARKILVHPDSLEFVEARVTTPSSSITFNLQKPQGRSSPPSLTWHAPSIDFHELGFPCSLKLSTSGAVKGIVQTSELWSMGTRPSAWPLAYNISQNLDFDGNHFSLNGELSFAKGWFNPVFVGNLDFDALDPTSMMKTLREASNGSPVAFHNAVERLAVFLSKTRIEGPLTGSTKLEVSSQTPDRQIGIEGVLTLGSGKIADKAIQYLRLPFQMEDGALNVNQAVLETEVGEFRLDNLWAGLPWNGRASEPWRLEAFFSKLEADRLIQNVGLPAGMSGSIRMEATADGLRGDVTLGAFRVGQVDFADMSALFHSSPDIVSIDRLEAGVDGQQIIGHGEISNSSLALEMESKDLPISLVLREVQGSIDANVKLIGEISKPRLEATISARNVELTDISAEKLTGHLQMADPLHEQKAILSLDGAAIKLGGMPVESVSGTLEVSGREQFKVRTAEALVAGDRWRLNAPVDLTVSSGVFSCGQAEFSGGLGKSAQVSGSWARDGKIDGIVALRGLPVRLPVPGAAMTIGGRLDADASIHGNTITPSGTVVIGLTADQNGLVSRFDAKASITEGQLTADGDIETPAGVVHLQGIGLSLINAGHLPLTTDQASVHGKLSVQNFDLSRLNLPGHPLAGTLTASGRIDSFTKGWPEMAGEFHVNGEGATLPGVDVKMRGAHGAYAITPGRLLLSGVEVESSGGTFSVEGALSLGEDGVEDLRFDVGTKRLAVSLQQGVHRGVLSGNVRLSGTPGKPVITGTVTLKEVATRFPRHWDITDISSDVMVYDSRNTTVGSKRKKFLEGLEERISGVELDLNIEVPGNMDLSLGDLHLLLKGRLTARNKAGHLVLNGAFSPEQGEYLVRGRVFKVTEGTVTFNEGTGVNGVLHAKASCQLPGALITAQVRGSINVPEIYLESSPWMPEEDIMASVVLGRPRTPAEQRDAAEKGAMASALVGEGILDRLREMTGRKSLLESVSVSAGTTREGEHSLSVGKYLSDDLLVSYEYMLNTGEPGQVSLEYKLGRGFSVESQMQGGERNGVDLLWKKDF